MAEFKKLSEVEQIETASENATVLIEEEGEIKRVPKKEVGGADSGSGSVIFYYETPMVEEQDLDSNLFRCNKTYAELMEIYNSKFYELGDAIYVYRQGDDFDVYRCNSVNFYSDSIKFKFEKYGNDYIGLRIYDDDSIEEFGVGPM